MDNFMELINELLNTTINSFDFGYCVTVNVLTYIIIKTITDIIGKDVKKWQKRCILLISIILVSSIYFIVGTDTKLLLNSSILAPICWSWIFRPIFKYFGLDYKKINNTLQ